jgi:hypothetical protein
MNASGQAKQAPPPPQQNTAMSNSTTERFNKELGKHGYLKHTAPVNYAPPQKYSDRGQYNPNDSASAMNEPYKREAGKTTSQNQASKSTSLGNRNLNRRIVEDNILRNQSAERMRADDSFQAERA